MNKALLIIKREYLTRVRKRTFLLITFLSPILFALIFIAPILISELTSSEKTVYVIDKSGYFEDQLPEREEVQYQYLEETAETGNKALLQENPSSFILRIPDFSLDNPKDIQIISDQNAGISLTKDLENAIEKRLRNLKIKQAGVDKSTLESLEVNVELNSIILSEEGTREGSTAAASIVSFAGGFLIYIFISLYGGQVTSGVHEEKSSRIVEILVSSVRPFQLMLGKIVGIALVGLTQFLLWIVLTLIIVGISTIFIGATTMGQAAASDPEMMRQGMDQSQMLGQIQSAASSINIPLLMGAFIFYFLGGYFLYSSLFAAVAAAVDNQSDMRQFIFPLSIPLIISIVVTQAVLENPNSGLAVWMSIIPFTSPVIMMARIPFGVPPIELVASIIVLILGFIGAVWMAGKVYRTGILLYGKKITFKELVKWIFY